MRAHNDIQYQYTKISKVKLNIYIYQNCVNVERERAGGYEDRYVAV